MCYGWSPFCELLPLRIARAEQVTKTDSLDAILDAESQVEEYERILSGEIKIPVRKGYSAEGRDLLLKVRRRCPYLSFAC